MYYSTRRLDVCNFFISTIAIMDIDQEKSMLLSTQAVNAGISHAHAYKAVALLDSGFGFRSAQVELDLYFAQIENDEINSFDPIAFFAIYSIWKGNTFIHTYTYPYICFIVCISHCHYKFVHLCIPFTRSKSTL